MLYSQELLEEIQAQNDIVRVIGEYVPLKQKGRSYFGLCPFHHENTPSFSVDAEKQFYYCFGCGAGGNVFQFIMQWEGMEFPEAVKQLAERAHIMLPEEGNRQDLSNNDRARERLLLLHRMSGRFYFDQLSTENGSKARSYLIKRQLESKTIRKFGLGYAPNQWDALTKYLTGQGFTREELLASGLVSTDQTGGRLYDRFRNRLMFPIFDSGGKVIAFGGRILGTGQPKYLNSPETMIFSKSKNLYGLNFAKTARSRELILVEGYMDMVSIYQAGFHNVAASLGTAFNKEHTRVLRRFASEVILLFDSDEAGTAAALRAIPVLVPEGFRVKVLQVPDGKDPDEFIRQKGAKAFGRLLLEAKSHIAFSIDCIRRKYNLENIEHKVLFTTEAAETLLKVESDIERDLYCKEVAKDSGVAVEAIYAEIAKKQRKLEQDFRREADRKRKYLYKQKEPADKKPKGLLAAQRQILYFCALNPQYCQKVQEYLVPEDFLEKCYQELARLIFDAVQTGKKVLAGEVMNYFPLEEEQKLISQIFALPESFETIEETEKAISEEIKVIKKAMLDKRAANAASVAEIQEIIQETKKLDQIFVKFSSEG